MDTIQDIAVPPPSPPALTPPEPQSPWSALLWPTGRADRERYAQEIQRQDLEQRRKENDIRLGLFAQNEAMANQTALLQLGEDQVNTANQVNNAYAHLSDANSLFAQISAANAPGTPAYIKAKQQADDAQAALDSYKAHLAAVTQAKMHRQSYQDRLSGFLSSIAGQSPPSQQQMQGSAGAPTQPKQTGAPSPEAAASPQPSEASPTPAGPAIPTAAPATAAPSAPTGKPTDLIFQKLPLLNPDTPGHDARVLRVEGPTLFVADDDAAKDINKQIAEATGGIDVGVHAVSQEQQDFHAEKSAQRQLQNLAIEETVQQRAEKVAAVATEKVASLAEPALKGVGIYPSTDRAGGLVLGVVPDALAAYQNAKPIDFANAIGALAEAAKKSPEVARIAVRDVAPLIADKMSALASAHNLLPFERKDGKPEYVLNLFGADNQAALALGEAGAKISEAAGQYPGSGAIPKIRLPDAGTVMRQYVEHLRTDIGGLETPGTITRTDPNTGKEVALVGAETLRKQEDTRKLIGYLAGRAQTLGQDGHLDEIDSERLLSALRGDFLWPWQATHVANYADELRPIIKLLAPADRKEAEKVLRSGDLGMRR